MLSDAEKGFTGFSADNWESMSENERSLKVFQHYDKNNDGSLDRDEFGYLLLDLEITLQDAEAQKVFTRLDKDGNGKVSFEEFHTVGMVCRG